MLDMNTSPPPPDAALPARLNYMMETLRAALPPPTGNTPEDLARRDAHAMDLVACLAPADEIEAALVTQYVVTGAHARYCLWEIGHYSPISDEAMKLRKQAASLMHQSVRSRSQLLTMQEARFKREAAANKAARAASPVPGAGVGAGGGAATPGGGAAASGGGAAAPGGGHAPMPPAQPPASVPAEATKPAAPGRPPPVLRLIRGGLPN
jgi:hypothetical protein